MSVNKINMVNIEDVEKAISLFRERNKDVILQERLDDAVRAIREGKYEYIIYMGAWHRIDFSTGMATKIEAIEHEAKYAHVSKRYDDGGSNVSLVREAYIEYVFSGVEVELSTIIDSVTLDTMVGSVCETTLRSEPEHSYSVGKYTYSKTHTYPSSRNIYSLSSAETRSKYEKAISNSIKTVITQTRVSEIREYEGLYREFIDENFKEWEQPKVSRKMILSIDEYELFSVEGQDELIQNVIMGIFGVSIDDLNDDWGWSNSSGDSIKVEFGDNYSLTLSLSGDINIGQMGMNRLNLKELYNG
jgi:hypothetical protein